MYFVFCFVINDSSSSAAAVRPGLSVLASPVLASPVLASPVLASPVLASSPGENYSPTLMCSVVQ